ncbi:MAG: hypothetical protein IIC67_02080 [Thaumarchaeota archaeon]|nr:hypothetical protein [Nitrososphaerota archaeon]
MTDNANRIFKMDQAFTRIFTEGMQSIKPENQHATDFKEQMKAWVNAFAFKKELQYYVSDITNVIGLAGQPNRSDNYQEDVDKLVKQLNDEFNSSKFEEMMNIAKPKLPRDDDNYDEKIKLWCDAFTFPEKLKNFGKILEKILEDRDDARIPIARFYIAVDNLIKNLEK